MELIAYLEEQMLESDCISCIFEREIVEELLEELLDYDYMIDCDFSDEADILMVSVVGDTLIIEEPFTEEGEPVGIEADVLIIQDGILMDCEIEEYCDYNELTIIEVEEDEYEKEKMEEMVDIIEEYSLLMEDTVCPCCIRDIMIEFAEEVLEWASDEE